MSHRKRKVVQIDDLLKLLCIKVGMGQQDFEMLLNVNQGNLSRYLKGTRSLPANAIIKMAALYLKVRDLPAATAAQRWLISG